MANNVKIKVQEDSTFMKVVPYLVLVIVAVVLIGLVAYKLEWGFFKDKLTKDNNEEIISNVLGNNTNSTQENETIIIEKIVNCNKTDNNNIYIQGTCTEFDNETILNIFNDYCNGNTLIEFKCVSSGCVNNQYDCEDWMGEGSVCLGGKCIQSNECSENCWNNGYLGGFCGVTNSTITNSLCSSPRNGVYLEIVGMKSDSWCSLNSNQTFCCCY